jgi:hypothetical protein
MGEKSSKDKKSKKEKKSKKDKKSKKEEKKEKRGGRKKRERCVPLAPPFSYLQPLEGVSRAALTRCFARS